MDPGWQPVTRSIYELGGYMNWDTCGGNWIFFLRTLLCGYMRGGRKASSVPAYPNISRKSAIYAKLPSPAHSGEGHREPFLLPARSSAESRIKVRCKTATDNAWQPQCHHSPAPRRIGAVPVRIPRETQRGGRRQGLPSGNPRATRAST